MKVFLVNNRFRFSGGVETVVENSFNLLKQHGIDVSLIERDSRDLSKSLRGKFRAFGSGIYSHSAYKDFKALIKDQKPDVIHIHNLYPLFSPSILRACHQVKIPVVMSCHTFRLTCPQGQHYDGKNTCERCSGGHEYWCIFKNCRNNIFESMAYAIRNMVARKLRLFKDHVTVYIALSQFSKDRIASAGFDEDRIFVLPNIAPVKNFTIDESEGQYAAYAGRLSPEKGVEHIIFAARQLADISVKIAGDGPIFSELAQKASINVKFVGRLDHKQMLKFYEGAKFLVFPSNWYEVCPMVILESLSCGLPVIASRIGGLPELVEDHKTGLLFEPGNSKDLARKMSILWENPKMCEKMGIAAIEKASKEYGQDLYYDRLMDIYDRAIVINKMK